MKMHRATWCLILLLCSVLVFSCKTSDDATAAAQQLATTSTDLTNYYATLAQVTTTAETLGSLQNNILPHGKDLPFPDSTRALLDARLAALQNRADLAKALQGVSAAFSSLTGSSAPTDVSNAASKLGTELTSVKAIPSADGTPIPISSAIGDAGKLITSLIQQHEEKKLAPTVDKAVSALTELFTLEQKTGVYDSIYHTYLTTSQSLANYGVEHNLVDVTSVLVPALQPFGLTGNPASTANIATLTSAAEAQIDATNKSLDAAHQKASTAMQQALTEMSARIHQLATDNSMPSRGTPITLNTVENWISTAKTYLSASTSTPSSSPAGNSTTSASGKKPSK